MNDAFGVGNVLGRAFRVWARNFLPFVVITAIIYSPVFVYFSFMLDSAMSLEKLRHMDLVASAMMLLLNVFAGAPLVYGVVMELQGKRASIGTCVAIGFKRMIPALGVSLLSALAIGGAMLLLVVPGIIVMCMLYVAIPAYILEQPGVMGALRRSSDLTRGHKGQIFGIVFLMWLVAFAASMLIVALYTPKTFGDIKVMVYLGLGVRVIVGSLNAVISGVAYYLLRGEKEGTSATELASVFE